MLTNFQALGPLIICNRVSVFVTVHLALNYSLNSGQIVNNQIIHRNHD